MSLSPQLRARDAEVAEARRLFAEEAAARARAEAKAAAAADAEALKAEMVRTQRAGHARTVGFA
jgi:hypothetical protein